MGLTNQLAAHFTRHDQHKIIRGILIAAFSFVAMGTVTAVWRNPYFTRMTPIEGWEFPSLLIFSSLAGVFVAIRQPSCSAKKAGFGSMVPFAPPCA